MRDFSNLQQKLKTRSDELTHRVQKIKSDLSRSHSADWSEQSQERENDEVLNQLGHDSEREIQEINAALNRLQNDHYGDCLKCAKPISMQRLEVKPEAALCTECAEDN